MCAEILSHNKDTPRHATTRRSHMAPARANSITDRVTASHLLAIARSRKHSHAVLALCGGMPRGQVHILLQIAVLLLVGVVNNEHRPACGEELLVCAMERYVEDKRRSEHNMTVKENRSEIVQQSCAERNIRDGPCTSGDREKKVSTTE